MDLFVENAIFLVRIVQRMIFVYRARMDIFKMRRLEGVTVIHINMLTPVREN